MIETVLTALCSIILLTGAASAQNAFKRGQRPYAAFIYYTDESIVDISGERFLQSAVLIKLDWLISASVDPQTNYGVVIGFPEKTLMARVGAVAIDSKFTLNEEEEEQEREVVQIVRPFGHVTHPAINSDITLLRTLLPFQATQAVAVANLNLISQIKDKSCTMLIFNKKPIAEERVLTEITVEMQSSKEQCGIDFIENKMGCAYDSDESKSAVDEVHYCHGNAGGALICEGAVAGIQSYIDQVCRQPHMFHIFYGWKSFIDCGVEQKCKEDSCQKVCSTVDKDEIKSATSAVEINTKFPPEENEASEANTHIKISEVEKSSETAKMEEVSSSTTTVIDPTLNTVADNTTTETTITTNSTTEPSTTTIITEPSTSTTTTTTTSTSKSKTTTTTTMTTTAPTTPTTQSTSSTIVTETHIETTPTAQRGEMEIFENITVPPISIIRRPKIQHHVVKEDVKTNEQQMTQAPSGRRNYQPYNSSSARYINGLIIIFSNFVLAI